MNHPLHNISICIPCYEQQGDGHRTLAQLLKSIALQNCPSAIRVYISDNSKDDKIRKMVRNFADLNPLIFIGYKKSMKRGVSANSNAAIKMATTEFIKIMYQDDFFVTKNAVALIIEKLHTHHWVVCDSVHVNNEGKILKNVTPHLDKNRIIRNIENTIGMPSVVAWRKTKVTFDEKLKTALDTDFYGNMLIEHGLPGHIHKTIIAQRIWNKSVSSIQPDATETDKKLIAEKHTRAEPTENTSAPKKEWFYAELKEYWQKSRGADKRKLTKEEQEASHKFALEVSGIVVGGIRKNGARKNKTRDS